MDIQQAINEIYDELRHYGEVFLDEEKNNVRYIIYFYMEEYYRVALVFGQVAQITVI